MNASLFLTLYKNLIVLLVVVIFFTVIQIWLSKKAHWWQGILVPVIYLVAAIPYSYSAFLTTGPISLRPDYYQAATFLFPGIWFLMIYFIFYYYYKCKKEA